jgi:hypothetical protein
VDGFAEVLPAGHEVNWDWDLHRLRGGLHTRDLVGQNGRKRRWGILIKNGHVRSNNTGMELVETNNEFNRVTFLFVAGEYMSKGIAQSKFWLKIGAVKHVVDAMQVASCQNPVLKGGEVQALLLLFL